MARSSPGAAREQVRVPDDAVTLESTCPRSRNKDARGDTDKGSSCTCPWSLIPLRGVASHQVWVPDDAVLRVHVFTTPVQEGAREW